MTGYFDQEWRDRKAEAIQRQTWRIRWVGSGAFLVFILFMVALGAGSAIGMITTLVVFARLIKLIKQLMVTLEEAKQLPESHFRDE